MRSRAVAVHAPLLRCAHTTAPPQRGAQLLMVGRLDGDPNVLMDQLAQRDPLGHCEMILLSSVGSGKSAQPEARPPQVAVARVEQRDVRIPKSGLPRWTRWSTRRSNPGQPGGAGPGGMRRRTRDEVQRLLTQVRFGRPDYRGGYDAMLPSAPPIGSSSALVAVSRAGDD